MRRLLIVFMLFLAAAHSVHAEPFSPTLLRIDAPDHITLDFEDAEHEIPVTVSGTPAGIVFSIFSRNRAAAIGEVRNGHLGWHYVNKIDTCVYFSSLHSFEPGDHVIEWDGRASHWLGDDRNIPPGEYTYYLWAFDNLGSMKKMNDHPSTGRFLERDEEGLPLERPVYYGTGWRWTVGNDPLDETLLETTAIPLADGWETGATIPARGAVETALIDPHDPDFFHVWAGNDERGEGGILKYRWVPGGEAEPAADFGTDGRAEAYDRSGGGSFGVVSDGDYLYTSDENHLSSGSPDAQFYIYDFDGALVDSIDLSPWWSDPSSADAGGQVNGGPNYAHARNGLIHLNCHCSCLNQLVDPAHFLETGDPADFIVWSNGNGDYTGDKNFEETSHAPWVCNDYTVGPYKYTISADDKGFALFNAYDVGAVTFGMYGPDGTGMGFFARAGETADYKEAAFVVDSGTPYDGLYMVEREKDDCNGWCDVGGGWNGVFYLGHDSISGRLTMESGKYLNITRPAARETIARGYPYTITWASWKTDSATLEFSSDGGETWETLAAGIDPSAGSFQWDVPDIQAWECRVRIIDDDDSTVVSEVACSLVVPVLTLIAPLSGKEYFHEDRIDIMWSSSGISSVSLDYSLDGGATWQTIMESTDAKQRYYRWNPPPVHSTECLVRISDAESRPIQDTTNGVFTIHGGDVPVENGRPEAFSLSTPFPNPFNPATTIAFTLPERLHAAVAVYNTAGQRVAVLHDGALDAGRHSLVWDAGGCAAGVYICVVEAGEHHETVRMTLVK